VHKLWDLCVSFFGILTHEFAHNAAALDNPAPLVLLLGCNQRSEKELTKVASSTQGASLFG
jgi:hypothetical protein